MSPFSFRTHIKIFIFIEIKNNIHKKIYCSPSPPKEPEKEPEWSEEETDVVHLTDATFDDYIANNPSVLVMFYAPCKYMT